jgi:dTDP-4-amino-4,6-dideoxygalactose transaminase
VIWRCDLTAQYAEHQDAINRAIRDVLESGKYIHGPNVEAFEHEFAAYVGTKHAVGVNSGTDALVMALWTLGVKPGDEVITTPFTAIPTFSALRHVGAVPVFVDIEPDTFLMDLTKVAAAITARTTAVVPVHLFGNVVDVPKLREIVGPDIRILEDCAQSHGATLGGRQSGTFGDAAAFSFYPTKNLGAYGDGGIILTNDEGLARAARSRRMYGMISKDEFVEDGINTRLDELQAAILRVKLRHLDAMNARRRQIAALYEELIDPAIMTPQKVAGGVVPNFHVYATLCAQERDKLVAALDRDGIQTNIYYPMPLTEQKGYRGAKFALPVAKQVSQHVMALPMYPEIPEKYVRQTAQAINAFFTAKT